MKLDRLFLERVSNSEIRGGTRCSQKGLYSPAIPIIRYIIDKLFIIYM